MLIYSLEIVESLILILMRKFKQVNLTFKHHLSTFYFFLITWWLVLSFSVWISQNTFFYPTFCFTREVQLMGQYYKSNILKRILGILLFKLLLKYLRFSYLENVFIKTGSQKFHADYIRWEKNFLPMVIRAKTQKIH